VLKRDLTLNEDKFVDLVQNLKIWTKKKCPFFIIEVEIL
jgi:hypothetical protein